MAKWVTYQENALRRKLMTRYSAFKLKEVEADQSKALVSVDSMIDWNEHAYADVKGSASKLYGMLSDCESDDENEEFALMSLEVYTARYRKHVQ